MAILDTEIDDELETEANEALDTETEMGDESESVPEPEAGEETEESEGGLDVIVLKGETPEEIQEQRGPLPNKLRRLLREKEKALRETNRRLQELEARAGVAPEQLRPKPKIEDFGYDADKFSEALIEWTEEKRVKVDEPARRQKEQAEVAERELKVKQEKYNRDKQSLRVRDFPEAEATVASTLSDVQQGLLLELASPEVAVYAIGTRPKLLAELAGLSPAKFAVRIGRLEAELSIERKSPAPAPEARVPRAAGTVSVSADRMRLRELEKKFEKNPASVDRGEIIRLRKQLKG